MASNIYQVLSGMFQSAAAEDVGAGCAGHPKSEKRVEKETYFFLKSSMNNLLVLKVVEVGCLGHSP